MAIRNPTFGNFRIGFDKVANKTLGEVFGLEPIMPSEMVKRLWVCIRENGLAIGAKKSA